MDHGPAAGVARGPALAWPRIRRVPVGPQHPVVDPRMRDGRDHVVLRPAQHRRGDRGGRQPHQDHVVQADAVERVLQRIDALDLVRLDRPSQHVAHGDRLALLARLPVGDRQDRAEGVRRVPPLGGQPGVVEVEPSDQRADVECGLRRIELERRARHAGAARDFAARHQRPKMLHAIRELHRQHRAGQRIQKHVARGVVGLARVDPVIDHVVGDVDHRRIGCGTVGGTNIEVAHAGSVRR